MIMEINNISAVIPVKNEGSRILRQNLENISDLCNEIIIILDDGTTDNSFEICKEYTDKIYFHSFRGISSLEDDPLYAGLKYVSNKWLLIHDADLIVSRRLKEEIRINLSTQDYIAYSIPCCNFIAGKWFIHKEHWTVHYRLFNREKVTFRRNDMHGREFDFNGKTGALENPVLHYGVPDVSYFIQTMDRYTSLDAEHLLKNRKGGAFNRENIDTSIYSIKEGYEFVIRQFFEDIKYNKEGEHGFIFSMLMGMYRFTEDAKIWELNWRKNNPWQYGDLSEIEQVADQIAEMNDFPEKYDESYFFLKNKKEKPAVKQIIRKFLKGLTPPYIVDLCNKMINK